MFEFHNYVEKNESSPCVFETRMNSDRLTADTR